MPGFILFVFFFFFFLIGSAIFEAVVLRIISWLGFYTIVQECQAKVYILFGKVIGTIAEPGLHLLPAVLGPQSFLLPFFGRVVDVDLRLDQEYLRSQAVNSEEGTPMGIGVWYEMRVTDPVEFLFRNTDPRGSLRANVANATVRSLSNMPLPELLQNRHSMSHVVRDEVTPKAEAWGYEIGSTYIRKVHFRDVNMIRQIEQKVVNRLRQVTSAIRQDGDNQVNIIKSAADREAAVEFARAAALRPQLVGQALEEVARDPDILHTLFDVLETEKLLGSAADLILVPSSRAGDFLVSGMVAHTTPNPVHQARKKSGVSEVHVNLPSPPPLPNV